MRFFGAFLILVASGLGGMVIARSYSQRPREITALLTALQLLETEIEYARAWLPDALMRASQCGEPAISRFFREAADNLASDRGLSAEEAWRQALERLDESSLTRTDRQALADLGSVLGQSDGNDQCRHLRLLQHKLELALKRAEDERDKNWRLWNYLGFGVGTVLVILLF